MNELETILSLIEDKTKNSHNYSEEDINRFASIFETVSSIISGNKSLSSLTDEDLAFLKENNLIDENIDLPKYIRLLSSYSNVIGNKLTNDLKEKTDKELENIIIKLTEISKEIDNPEMKALINKVNKGFSGFNDDDLDLLHTIILESDKSDEEKRDLALYVLLNSVNFENEIVIDSDEIIDSNDEYAKDYDEIEKSRKGLTEEECIELFARYGYNFKELGKKDSKGPKEIVVVDGQEVKEKASPAQELILEKGNYEQIEKILQLLKERNINLNDNCGHNIIKEKANNIAQILVKSNARCVEEIIDFTEKYGFIENDELNFYKMVITPRKFILRKIKYRANMTNNGGGGDKGKDPLDIGGSHEDFIKNVELFSDICRRLHTDNVVFLKKYFDKYNGELLDEPHDKVLGTIEILKRYGYEERDYFDKATTIFSTTHATDTLDLAIELDILDDYVKDNPSILLKGYKKDTQDMLYILSRNKGDLLQETTYPNFVGESIDKKKIRPGGLPAIDSLLRQTEIPKGIKSIIKSDELIKTFEERIKEKPSDISIDENDLDSPVNILDEKYKVSDTLYNIDGIRISRLKVIRVYNALKDLEELDENGKNNIVRYAIARNSYLQPAELNKLFDSYKEAKLDFLIKRGNIYDR